MRILPPKQELVQLLGSDDFFLWEYYGEGILGKIQSWIFKSRIKVLMEFLRQTQLASEYMGVDIMDGDRLRKYRYAMRNIGVKQIEAIKASAELLPFRDEIFDFALSRCI